ncbi:MAG: DUF881 domain-containing protein [Candidatus Limnocylindria bacterium]
MTSRVPARPRQLFRPQWTVSMAAALATIGFVGAAQWNSSLGREEFISSAQSVLVSQAEQLQREQEGMLAEIEQAEADLQVLQERDSGSQTALAQLNERLLAARVAAGAETMRGPGVVVEIADSLRDRPAGEPQQNFIVLVSDLRDIVTALWGSGAEAISISGSLTEGAPSLRLVSTTSIYGAGAAILVNGVAVAPPYRIAAIGPEGLNDRFLAHPAFLDRVLPRVEAYGLQFASQAQGEVTVRGFVGNTRFQWGAPVAEPT